VTVVRRRPAAARARRIAAIAAALLGVVLGGCSFAPTYERPPAPVAAVFPQPGAARGAPAASIAWPEFIEDPRTRALVQVALRENRDLRTAALAVEQAQALLGVQRADRLPSVGLGVSAERSSTASLYRAGFVLSPFEIDLFGRVRSLTEAAAARALASAEAQRAVRLSLIAAVASAELVLRADDELIALTEQVLASRDDALRLTRLKFDAGAAGEPELRSVESLAAGARATLIALQRQRAQDLNALVLLLGRPLPEDLPPPRPLDDHRLRDLPAGLPSEVLLARPDVLAAEQRLIAANADIGAARAAFFPRITLTGSLGTASGDLSGLFGSTGWTFVPQLLQPIFDAGRNEAGLAATTAGRDIALAQYEKAIQTAFAEVADALAGQATLGAQREAQQAQADAEWRRAQQVERLFEAGAASAFERLDAQRTQLLARLAVIQTKLAERQNAVRLYQVLGGGALAPAAP
jgi:NodT family efflux transporter outer membrane factor (OMF) lipoprotein